MDEAYSKLQACLSWRRQYGMQDVTYEDISREAATGKAYLHSHVDVYGRPALVVRVARCAIIELPWQRLTSALVDCHAMSTSHAPSSSRLASPAVVFTSSARGSFVHALLLTTGKFMR